MSSAHPHSHKGASQSSNSASMGHTDNPEQLRKENAELLSALATSREENVLLNDVISTISSTLELDEVLSHLVDTIVRAISCHAAFIYLYNKEKDRLVLASTTEQYQHQVGKITLALGEGTTGWVGLTLKPLILKDEALEDPRFRYFPDLEEEKFQSTMTVPIIGKDRHLIGVITMHAVDRYVWEKLREINEASFHKDNVRGQTSEISTHALERLNPLKDIQFKALLSAPLIAGAEHLGLINCYSSQPRRYTSEDYTLLSTISNQVAIAIKNSHLVDR